MAAAPVEERMAVEQEATAKQEKGSTVAAAMVAGAEVEGVRA